VQGTSGCKDLNIAEKLFRLQWSWCRPHCSYLIHDYLKHQFMVNQRDNTSILHNNKEVMRPSTWQSQAADFADCVLKNCVDTRGWRWRNAGALQFVLYTEHH